jgi:hypothetical protein
MDWETLKKWVRPLGHARQARSAPFVLPSVVVEVEPHFVAGARLDGAGRQIHKMGVRELNPGALVPVFHRPNFANEGTVRKAVSEVAAQVGNANGRLGLLLPDAAVRVATLRFETLPDDRKEAEALVRWRMRDTLPFPPEEARVCYQVLGRGTKAVELLALAVRSSVLAEYEAVLEGVDGGAGLILPATMALLPLIPESTEGQQLLIHVFSSSITSVVVAGGGLRFWRNRSLNDTAPGEALGEVTREVGRTLAALKDHLQIELDRVWVCDRPPAIPGLGEELARTLGREVHSLPGGDGQAATLPVPEQELYKSYGRPFAGLLANSGKER